jgi:aminoglycoside phosphotransferase (APT) family kinase protein
VHGELGFHNLMADDSKFTAVLDWELTHVGSPAEDLGYIKDYVEWVGPFDTFLDLYEKAGGPRPDAQALHYYELFKMIRNGGIYLSAIQGFNRGLNDNPMLPSICLALYSGYVERIDSLLRQVMGVARK